MSGARLIRPVATLLSGVAFAVFACFAALPAATDGRSRGLVWPAASVSAMLALEENASRISRGARATPRFEDPAYAETTRAILLREPAAFNAMSVRALTLDKAVVGAGNPDDTARRMSAIDAVYRREGLTNLWLIQHRLAEGELAPALDQLDSMLRTVGEQRSSVLILLAPVLAAPEAREPLMRILRNRPEWEPNFWYAVTRNSAATRNGLILRSALVDPDRARDSDQDAELIQRGIEQRLFDDAGMLYSSLTGTQSLSRLRSAQFDAQPRFPPFDWQLVRGQGLNASIDSSRHQLRIYAGPTGTGTAAKQVVQLPAGRYSLALRKASHQTDRGDDGVVTRVVCLTGGNRVLAKASVGPSTTFSVPTNCSWQEVTIDIDFAATAREIVIDAVDLAPSV